MAELIELSAVAWRDAAPGVRCAVIVDRARQGAQEMMAELYRLASGSRAQMEVPEGSDRYLFTLSGHARLAGIGGGMHDLGPRTFAALAGPGKYTLEGAGDSEATVLSVVAPPPGTRRDLPGGRETLVARVADLPVVEERDSGKRRTYLATERTTGSKRAHGMIVAYRGDTVTPKHHHPDAESLFVFLDGKGLVLVNDREVQVGPGTAIFFNAGDLHALRSVDDGGMAFLEFHVPGVYQVVRV